MKPKIINAIIVVMLVTVMISCKEEDKYTIENKAVTGTLSYVRTEMVPIEFDPSGNPITFQISFTGSGNISDIGEVNLVTTFKFSFLTFMGYDFETTYSGATTSDSFTSTGFSELEQDFSGVITEMVSSGTGKFANIIGGGQTMLVLNPDQTTGTGEVNWTITY
jgi:hypothetical protein